ncbi:MAG: vWA domain-containing protein, partial [Bacteroidota bacterium]
IAAYNKYFSCYKKSYNNMKKYFYFFISIFLSLVFFSSCEEGLGEDASEPTPSSGDESLSNRILGGSSGNGEPSEPGVITAGEWNDLENWDFWMNLIQKDTISLVKELWGFYPDNRYTFTISDKNLLPVIDAPIKLLSGDDILWETRTDNLGKATLWVNLFDQSKSSSTNKIAITVEGKTFEYTNLEILIGQNNEIKLPVATQNKYFEVDLAFVVDATGSMGDELEYLKTELLDVVSRVESRNAAIKLNLGAVFYRDEGDEYVTRVSNISENSIDAVEFIQKQSADGGGDYPEAVHVALSDAVSQLSWSNEARTRILFLVLDAPPHQETPAVLEKIRTETAKAAKKGIKIIPITASGIDKPTEFLMRFMALATSGTYVFITDDSGIGNDHLEPTVGEYEVEFLNDLMVRLVSKYSL